MSNTSPHILFDCLNIRRGGGVTVAARLIDRFSLRGWEVTVLVATSDVADTMAKIDGGKVIVVLRPHLVSQVKCLWFRHFGFSKFAMKLGTDLVFSFNYWTPYRGRQITYHINATPFFRFREIWKLVGLRRSIVQPLYSGLAVCKSTANYFESQYLMDLANRRYSNNINYPSVHYIGIDFPCNRPVRTNFSPGIITITSGGAHKRNDLVIELHRRLKSSGVEISLIIGGSREAIESSLSKSDLDYTREQESVRFIGYVSRSELYSQLSNATALVSCSEVESFFMVPLEAMSVGCPVICGRFASIEESVGTAGIVTKAGDITEMERWVVRLLDESVREKWSNDCLEWSKKFNAKDCSELIVSEVTRLVGA